MDQLATAAATLEPVGEARVALEAVEVEATIRGMLAEASLTQRYRNLEADPIEVVYTFPLPLDAVLLELAVELNGERLRGVVRARAAAESEYEEAIEEGHSAVLLEQLEPGLYTVNLGNLHGGEQAVVRVRYAQLLRWQGETLRFHLPTTVAPRYGDPAGAGLAPHQVPEHALEAGYRFALRLRIEGALARAAFECPSHPLAVSDGEGWRELALAGAAARMDRDFVLVLREPAGAASQALVADAEEGRMVLASFHPRIPREAPAAPRCVKLVLDCSGSMAGDSIVQARAALAEILGLLGPADWFQVVTFGSNHELLFAEPVPASPENRAIARAALAGLDADMGGTEIGAALEAAYRCGGPAGVPGEVLLVTDGEVWEHEAVIAAAARSGHRVFTVGVGSAVAEAFLRRLAERTGGACELVSPREAMAERIVRHFRRMSEPRAESVALRWPGEVRWQAPAALDALHAGDTVHVFACLAGTAAGEVALELERGGGERLREALALPAPLADAGAAETLVRLAAHRRLADLTDEQAAALAERHQLVTPLTSCVLVAERAAGERAAGVPQLRKVPAELAAGWGGMGSVDLCLDVSERARMSADFVASEERIPGVDERGELGVPADYDHDVPAHPSEKVGRRMRLRFPDAAFPDAPAEEARLRRRLHRLVGRLNARYPAETTSELDLEALPALHRLPLRSAELVALKVLCMDGVKESTVVLAFLAALAESPGGAGLSRHLRRLIRRAARDASIPPEVEAAVGEVVAGLAP